MDDEDIAGPIKVSGSPAELEEVLVCQGEDPPPMSSRTSPTHSARRPGVMTGSVTHVAHLVRDDELRRRTECSRRWAREGRGAVNAPVRGWSRPIVCQGRPFSQGVTQRRTRVGQIPPRWPHPRRVAHASHWTKSTISAGSANAFSGKAQWRPALEALIPEIPVKNSLPRLSRAG